MTAWHLATGTVTIDDRTYLVGNWFVRCAPYLLVYRTCTFRALEARGEIMSTYRIHSIESAPEKSKSSLRGLKGAFGIIPNIAGIMAASPALLNGFVGVFREVHAGSFTEGQIQALLLTNAVTNRSAWPVAFHSALALKEGVTAADVQAIRERRAPAEPKLAALSALTRALIDGRGKVDARALDAFRAAGFGDEQVLEILAVLAASTMTNYASNIAEPALEEMFQTHAWSA